MFRHPKHFDCLYYLNVCMRDDVGDGDFGDDMPK